MKVITDEKKIDKFLNRGVAEIYPSKEALKQKMMSGERIRAYQGFDPTGPYLHVGHAMGIRALRILQELGHEVIFLIGDFTARVGDPDKASTRKLLTTEEIEQNMSGWKQQTAQLIDFGGENPVIFKQNYDWLSKIKLEELIGLMSKATVQQMLERDLFQRRLKEGNPIQLQEFLYPLLQGFDSVELDVDLELGGTDQTFNMLVGRNVLKAYKNKEKFVRTNIMMEAPEGLTMSKTKGNGINLSDSPEDIYGKAMSYPDNLIIKGMQLLTDMEDDQIKTLEESLSKGANPMEIKKVFAFELTKLIKGQDSANKAAQHFETTVQNREVSEEDQVEITLNANDTVLDILKRALPEVSSAEIKRTIEQGGVEVDANKITDPISKDTIKPGSMVKYGKRRFFRVK